MNYDDTQYHRHDPRLCETRLKWVCPWCGHTQPYKCGEKRPHHNDVAMALRLKGDADAEA